MCYGLGVMRIAFITLALINGIYAFISVTLQLNNIFLYVVIHFPTEIDGIVALFLLCDILDIAFTITSVIGITQKNKKLLWIAGVIYVIMMSLCLTNLIVAIDMGDLLWLIILSSVHFVLEITAGILLAFILFDKRFRDTE